MSDALDGRVAVAIEGQEFDLNEACGRFSMSANFRICRLPINGQERCVLIADDMIGMDDDSLIYAKAQRKIDWANGIMFVDDPNRYPLKISDFIYRQSANGVWGVSISLPTAHMRLRASRISDLRGPDGKSRQESLLELAEKSEVVSDVLTYLRGHPDWIDLYKAYERMHGDAKKRLGRDDMATIKWPNKKLAGKFTGDAQFERHSTGHSWPQWPKEKAMSIAEARQFVREVFVKWIGSFP